MSAKYVVFILGVLDFSLYIDQIKRLPYDSIFNLNDVLLFIILLEIPQQTDRRGSEFFLTS